jgi:hypothetical protein
MELKESKYYVLDDERNVRAATYKEWQALNQKERTTVAETQIGRYFIVTKFFGTMDCLFETKVVDDMAEPRPITIQYMKCGTWEIAEGNHAFMVEEYTKRSG